MTDIGDISGMGANALRELAAPLRVFKSPAGALLWYIDQKANRDAHGLNMDGGGGPRSVESRDSANRTYGVLAACLGATDEHDDPDDPQIYAPDDSFSRLADWCRPKGYKESTLVYAAENCGMGIDNYNKWMAGLLRRFGKRVRARGLIQKSVKHSNDICSCGCGTTQVEESE